MPSDPSEASGCAHPTGPRSLAACPVGPTCVFTNNTCSCWGPCGRLSGAHWSLPLWPAVWRIGSFLSEGRSGGTPEKRSEGVQEQVLWHLGTHERDQTLQLSSSSERRFPKFISSPSLASRASVDPVMPFSWAQTPSSAVGCAPSVPSQSQGEGACKECPPLSATPGGPCPAAHSAVGIHCLLAEDGLGLFRLRGCGRRTRVGTCIGRGRAWVLRRTQGALSFVPSVLPFFSK